MRLSILGAAGGVGREVVRIALADGHEVRALVRDKERVTISHDRLMVAEGDATEAAVVASALAEADAVVYALGVSKRSAPDTGRRAMEHLLAAMCTAGITRLVAINGAATRVAGDAPGWQARMAAALARRLLPDVVADKQAEADLLAASGGGLAWTMVRPPRLADGPPRGGYRLSDDAPGLTARAVRRADVGRALVDLTVGGGHERQAPYLTY